MKKASAKRTAIVKKTSKGRKISIAPTDNMRAVMTEDAILEAFDMLGITAKLDDQKKKLFVAVAKANNLNPLRREIHAVERNQKVTDANGKETWIKVLTPVVGFEVFIDRAEQSGRLAYWNCMTTGTIAQKNLAATVTIKRRDWPREFIWTARHDEVSAKNAMWEKEPTHMTEKVAISRAFRLCFRDVLRDMPYTVEEEMTVEIPPQAIPFIEPRALPAPSAALPVVPDVPAKHEEKAVPQPSGPYSEIMQLLNSTETAKGVTKPVSIFSSNEMIDYKHEADTAKGKPDELAKILKDIRDTVAVRRATIKGETR